MDKMIYRDKLYDMVREQYFLNVKTNGELWAIREHKDGNIINWGRTIYMETAELIDSYTWKHWKNLKQEPDYLNIKIETVDIFHFLMSAVIEYFSKEYTKDKLLSNGKLDIDIVIMTIEDSVNFIYSYMELFLKNHVNNNKDKEEQDINVILEPYENLMLDALKLSKIRDLNNVKLNDILTLLNDFFTIITDRVDIKLDKLYHGKRILNEFRQNNGYKEGTYIKIWNGVEDNVIMFELLDKYDVYSLYDELEKVYQTVS